MPDTGLTDMYGKPASSFVTLALWQTLIVIALVLTFNNVLFSYGIKYFINIFSIGRSNFKIIFFLGFVFAVLLLRYFPPLKIPPFIPPLNFILATALYVLGAAEYFYFTTLHFSAPNHKVFAYYMGSVSSTEFAHIHNAKPVMAWVLQWFPHGDLSQYDFGLPYLFFYPGWLMGLHSLLYFVFFGLTIYQLRAYTRASLSVYALFVLCCFILLRNQLDGGLFFYESLVAFPIYGCIQWHLWRKSDTVRSTPGLWIPILLSLNLFGAIQLFSHWLHSKWLHHPPLRYFSLCLFLLAVYAVFKAIEDRKKWWAGSIAVAFVAGYIFLDYSGIYSAQDIHQLDFVIQKIDGVFTALVPQNVLPEVLQNRRIEVLKQQKVGDITIVTARPQSPLYLWQLHKEWGLPIRYGSIDLYNGHSCLAGKSYTVTGFIYIISSPLPYKYFQKSYGDIALQFIPAKPDNNYNKYALRLILPGCTPDKVEILKMILKDIGVERSVMEIRISDID